MISIREATPNDFNLISEIAHKTWPDTYGKILSAEQLEFMLNSFYSEETLRTNMLEKRHHFILLYENSDCLGFASYEHQYEGRNITRLHKLYVLPDSHGKGAGKKLIAAVEQAAKENGSTKMSLNVNRFNNAQDFYKHCGYMITASEDIDIGHGYLMQDYRMEKAL